MDYTFLNSLSQTCKKNPIFTLFLGLFLYVILSTVLIQLLFVGVSAFSNISYNSLLEIVGGDLSEPGSKFILRLLQGISQLLTWGMAAILMANLLGNPNEVLNIRFKIPLSFYVLAIFIIISSLPLVQLITFDPDSFKLPSFLEKWESWIHDSEIQQQKILLGLLFDAKFNIFISNLLVFAVIPAITEELFFRGFIQKTLSKYGIHWGIWISALLFSLVHFQFYGFISRLVLGGILGYLAYGAKSIFPAMLGHFTFNAITISSMYQAAVSGVDPENLLTPDKNELSYLWVLAALVSVTGLFILYFRQARIQKTLDI